MLFYLGKNGGFMDKLLSDLQAIKDRFRSEIKTVDQEQKLRCTES